MTNVHWSQQIVGVHNKRSVKHKEAYPLWGKKQNPGEPNLSDFFGNFKEYFVTMRLNKMFSCTRL